MTKAVYFFLMVGMMVASQNLQAKTPKSISCQAYTFKNFTLEEALDKVNELDIKTIEMYPGQTVLKGEEWKTHFSMTKEQRGKVKELLDDHGVKVLSYGVVKGKNEKEWRQLFEFAKDMGIKIIVSEPKYDQLDLVEELCEEFKIKVALHNHPQPTPYWNPQIVLNHLEGRSKLMGVCADVGHWTRSGLDAVGCLKLLEGRIFETHFKDVNATDKSGHSVIWGEGKIDMPGILKELKRQGFKGKHVIEYEYNWDNSVPDIRKSIDNFTAVLNQI